MDTPEAIAAEYLKRGATINIESAVSRGWTLVRDNMAVLILASVLAWLIWIGLSAFPIVGWAVGIVLVGGLDYLIVRRIRGEAVQVGDVFAGFNRCFLNLALAGIIKYVLVTCGLILCLIPGIYLAVGYVFALPLVIDKQMEFWPAMEVSRRVVHHHWWSILALVIVLWIVAIIGFLACIVGAVITVPIANAAFMYVYEDIFGEKAAAAAPSA